ncbi:MAG: 1,4-dihydroxy-6-naphthoate synthase [Bacteroidales bacterium]|nr:1,4-dihydroxy-6-naphthoate synthase [Bacteroidales bacterium]
MNAVNRYRLAFSSCPNDTFMFHALVHGLVDTEGLSFDVGIHDVEMLNGLAHSGTYDFSKLSYHGWFTVRDLYEMLPTGSALGWDCGPLLVCRGGDAGVLQRRPLRIAVPGRYTTGALLCSLAYPGLGEQIPMLFSDIEGAVGRGDVDLGVLIHEGRFTYRDKGLDLVCDLGSWWQRTSGCPIPLGGIAARRSLGPDIAARFDRALHRSITYAFAHPEASREYVASYARELSAEIQRKHIDMFVNDFSLDLGEEGRRAVDTLYERYERNDPSAGRTEALPGGRQSGQGA